MGHHDAVKRRLIEIATEERQPLPQGVSRLSEVGGRTCRRRTARDGPCFFALSAAPQGHDGDRFRERVDSLALAEPTCNRPVDHLAESRSRHCRRLHLAFIKVRALLIGTALSLFGHVASAQDVSRYRGYVLESSVESVVGTSGARSADAKTIHERPAKIQGLEWRAPYVSSGSELADPVRGIVFTFLDDALYQVVVSYDRDRPDGLTNNDIIDTLTAAYGAPVQG